MLFTLLTTPKLDRLDHVGVSGQVAVLATAAVLSPGYGALRAPLPSVTASSADPKISFVASPAAGVIFYSLAKPDKASAVVCVVHATTPLRYLWPTIPLNSLDHIISDVKVRGVLSCTGQNIKRKQQKKQKNDNDFPPGNCSTRRA